MYGAMLDITHFVFFAQIIVFIPQYIDYCLYSFTYTASFPEKKTFQIFPAFPFSGVRGGALLITTSHMTYLNAISSATTSGKSSTVISLLVFSTTRLPGM